MIGVGRYDVWKYDTCVSVGRNKIFVFVLHIKLIRTLCSFQNSFDSRMSVLRSQEVWKTSWPHFEKALKFWVKFHCTVFDFSKQGLLVFQTFWERNSSYKHPGTMTKKRAVSSLISLKKTHKFLISPCEGFPRSHHKIYKPVGSFFTDTRKALNIHSSVYRTKF